MVLQRCHALNCDAIIPHPENGKPNMFGKKLSRWLLALSGAAFIAFHSAGIAHADLVIGYGVDESGTLYIDLMADTAQQAIEFYVTGGDATDGFEFDLQIGDGGAEVGGTDTGPVFGAIDLVTNTIWSAASPNQADVVDSPLAKQSTVDTASLVSGSGLIGTVMFDTTGITSGEFAFSLTGVAGSFNTKFFNGANEITTVAPNGRLRIVSVPEPGFLSLLATCGLGLGLRRRRHAPIKVA